MNINLFGLSDAVVLKAKSMDAKYITWEDGVKTTVKHFIKCRNNGSIVVEEATPDVATSVHGSFIDEEDNNLRKFKFS